MVSPDHNIYFSLCILKCHTGIGFSIPFLLMLNMLSNYSRYFSSGFYHGVSHFCSVSVFAEDFKIVRFSLYLFMRLLYPFRLSMIGPGSNKARHYIDLFILWRNPRLSARASFAISAQPFLFRFTKSPPTKFRFSTNLIGQPNPDSFHNCPVAQPMRTKMPKPKKMMTCSQPSPRRKKSGWRPIEFNTLVLDSYVV